MPKQPHQRLPTHASVPKRRAAQRGTPAKQKPANERSFSAVAAGHSASALTNQSLALSRRFSNFIDPLRAGLRRQGAQKLAVPSTQKFSRCKQQGGSTECVSAGRPGRGASGAKIRQAIKGLNVLSFAGRPDSQN